MSITYNQHSKERENVVAPSVEEIEKAVAFLNHAIEYGNMSHAVKDIFQRMIWDYENLQHFHSVVGGWEGVEHLKACYDSLVDKTDTSIRECEGMCINPKNETE